MRPIDFPDTIDLAFDKTELLNGTRDEPLFTAAFPAAIVAQNTEATRLDPTRLDINPEPAPPGTSAWRGSIVSLLLHLLPLLVLLAALRPPLEIPQPIPVQLVIEQPQPPPPPPPPPPAQPAPRASPPPGLHSSDDFGDVGPPSPKKGADTAPAARGEPPPPAAEAKTAPPPDLAVESAAAAPDTVPPAPAKPAPPKQQVAARPPKLEGLELPLPVHPDQPQKGLASARFPGPSASRDEYCAYALALTTAHLNLLPLSQLGARRAETTVVIRLREDGTIVNTMVMRSSGYLDIDEKVVDMVKAVKQFPPFPLWLRGPTADFTLRMHFPNPLQH
jgi:periplasmic protein TonB